MGPLAVPNHTGFRAGIAGQVGRVQSSSERGSALRCLHWQRTARNTGSLRVSAIAESIKQVTAADSNFTSFQRVEILSESLPYLQQFGGKTIVVKYGGAAMKDPSLMVCEGAPGLAQYGVINDLVLLATVGILPVLVHGGGPEINTWLKKVGIQSQFDPETGLRVTDEPTMEVVQAVLAGTVNKNLVRLIQQAGGKAVGLCGIDSGLIMASQVLGGRIGLVGDITSINANLVKVLVNAQYLPVISSVALDTQGRSLNVNADIAAGEIAAALQAEKLILMTDVPGVMRDKNDIATKFTSLTISGVRELVADGTIAGGMIPKVECCVRCLAQGVRAAHIIDGRQRHSLLMELLTDEGVGTMITG